MGAAVGERERKAFQEQGFVVVKDLIPKQFIADMYATTLRTFLKYQPQAPVDGLLDAEPWREARFHQLLIQFRQASRELFGAMYDTVQTSAALQQYTGYRQVLAGATALLNEPAGIAGLNATGHMFRMDPPGDTRNRLEWHQESSYYEQNLDGNHGVVAWTPMQPLSKEHGPLVVCPGSHKLGRLTIQTSGKKSYETSEQFLVPQEYVDRFQEADVVAEPGSVVFFHFDLFHRSGYNVSPVIRFSATVRFHRALAEDFLPGRLIYHFNESLKARRQAVQPAAAR